MSSWAGRGRFDPKPQPTRPEQVRQVGLIIISTELASWGCWRAQDLGRPAGEDGLGEGGVSLVLGRAPRGDWALWMGVGDNLTCTRGCFWSQAWGLYSPQL